MIAATLAEHAQRGVPIVRLAMLLVVLAVVAYFAISTYRRRRPEQKDTDA